MNLENQRKGIFFNLSGVELPPCNCLNQDSSDETDANETIKIKNRMAAKKCREKKNAFLNKLETENDYLAREVLRLSYKALTLKTENKMLEENIVFFQSFLYSIMKKK